MAATAHADYWGYNGIVPNQTYQLEFIPRIVQNTTYWATMSVGSIGGYGGIQQWSSPNPATDHGGLFSIWDSTSTSKDSWVVGYNRFLTFKNYTFRFGGEGTGAQMLFKWPWVLGRPYRMAWRRYVEPGNAVARYEAFYYDPSDVNAAGWVWVGTIRKPVATDGARNLQGFEGFCEAYGGNTKAVREMDIRNVWLLTLADRWLNITAANMTDDRQPATLTAIGGGWRHRIYDTNLVFKAVNNLAMLPANDLAPIHLPFRINCGWGGTNLATNAQVAASLKRAFEPDAFWYGASVTNYVAGGIDVADVAHAAPALLYQSRREGTNFGYRLFGLKPDAPSLVRLHFAETDLGSPGSRLQHVLINGALVETNLDIYAAAGAQNRALVRDHIMDVGANGVVEVRLQSQTPGLPAVMSGLEVESLVPPYLGLLPESVTNVAGATVQFSVIAGGAEPLAYQWRKDGDHLEDGGNFSGARSRTLTVDHVLHGDEGAYSVVVSNALGSVPSLAASLSVLDPFITNQPASQLMTAGQTAVLSVTAVGTAPLSYQWRKDGAPLTDAPEATLTLTDVQRSDAASYDVVVSNRFGSVTSSVAALTVNLAVPDPLAPDPGDSSVNCLALQTDGRILVGGNFAMLGEQPCAYIGRLRSNGERDAEFAAAANTPVWSVAVQSDGGILVAGGQWAYPIARLHADGTPDSGFLAGADDAIYSLALQPDGKILVGGSFDRLNGQLRHRIGRLNPDGTLDDSFNPDANGAVVALAVQADGKILVGGGFTWLGGSAHAAVGRLLADGRADPGFNSEGAGGRQPWVYALVVQADDRILVGGAFSILGGQPRNALARLNPDGTLDLSFKPEVSTNSSVGALAVQADGKILVGGEFTALGGQACSSLGRLNPDGTADTFFNPWASGGAYPGVCALAIQEDGRILVGGAFIMLGGQARRNLARLINPDAATQHLGWDGSNIVWLRGGASPEVWRTAFEYSTNGADWTSLGSGTRIPGGWRSSDVDLPARSTIRARGSVAVGGRTGSHWVVETLAEITPPIRPRILVADGSFGFHLGIFGFNVTGSAGQVVVTEGSTDLVDWTGLATNILGGEPLSFIDRSSTNSPWRFFRALSR